MMYLDVRGHFGNPSLSLTCIALQFVTNNNVPFSGGYWTAFLKIKVLFTRIFLTCVIKMSKEQLSINHRLHLLNLNP
jgi:hypothetical protein